MNYLRGFMTNFQNSGLDEYTKTAINEWYTHIAPKKDEDPTEKTRPDEEAEEAEEAKSALTTIISNVNSITSFKSPTNVMDILDLIPVSIVDAEVKAALRDLSKVGEAFMEDYNRLGVTFQHPFLVNIGLIRLYTQHLVQTGKALSLLYSHPVSLSDDFLAHTRHYLRYAVDVYGESMYLSDGDILNNMLSHRPSESSIKLPRNIIFLDHITKAIVISIRGTASFHDVLTDLHVNSRPFLDPSMNLSAHCGMADSAEALLTPSLNAIQEARSRKGEAFKGYKVVITGHSLGAGTGCLLAMLLAQQGIECTVYAFAPPPVITINRKAPASIFNPLDMINEYVEKKFPRANIFSFVHHNDVIPRCSNKEIFNMITAAAAIDALPWSASKRAEILVKGRLSSLDEEHIKETLQKGLEIKDESPQTKLAVPGDIYWMKPCLDEKEALTKYQMYTVENGDYLFTGLLYSGDSMVADHGVAKYMSALLKVESE